MEELEEGFEYASPILEEEDDPWYVPKGDWSDVPKEFLPPEGTCNINFCTDINLRALDTITDKINEIDKLKKELELYETRCKLAEEQLEILKEKNKTLIIRLKEMMASK